MKDKETYSMDLTNCTLFNFLDELNINGQVVDLHNEYVCDTINFGYDSPNMLLKFIRHDKNNTVVIEFENPVIKKICLEFTPEDDVLTSMYRGRLEEDNEVVEVSKQGQVCFYLDFNNGNTLEILCEKAIVHLRKL